MNDGGSPRTGAFDVLGLLGVEPASVPHAVTPYYWHGKPNESISLYRGPFTLSGKSGTGLFRGQVVLHWLPRPQLMYEGVGDLGPKEMSFTLDATPGQVKFPKIDSDVPVSRPWRALSRPRRAGTVTTAHRMEHRFIGRKELPVATVVASVANFLPIHGSLIRDDVTAWPGRVEFGDGEWRVVLDARSDLNDQLKRLNGNGGFLMTHVASVERVNGDLIDADAAEDVVDALTYFLWFARGAPCGPVLPVGLGSDGAPAWALWSFGRLLPWYATWNWLDETMTNALARLFPGFMRRWNDPYWQKVIRVAIRYYHEANIPDTLEMATSLAHTVLDSLAFSFLVDERRLLTAPKYEDRRAGANVEQMLDLFRIDTRIPPMCADLEALLPGVNGSGPQAVARLRNDLMHLRRSRPERTNKQKIQGWKLAAWYLDLSLMRLFDYQGQYRNRLSGKTMTGAVEPVPWAAQTTQVT